MYNEYNFPLTIKSIFHIFSQFKNGLSVCRAIHNYFLKSIKIEKKILDLGSKEKYSSYKFMNTKNISEITFSDKYGSTDQIIYNDFEEKLNFKSESFDQIILFNVLEHVENYKKFLSEINRVLKKDGKLELYVPFLHYYHEDPKDVFRPTHVYLEKILKKNNFNVKITKIGTGPFIAIADIGCNYLYFAFIKILFFLICLFLEKIRILFSKASSRYYLGIHASCLKT